MCSLFTKFWKNGVNQTGTSNNGPRDVRLNTSCIYTCSEEQLGVLKFIQSVQVITETKYHN